tara:strand:- start:1494 stop:2357 length:864 start_codon:yes stop_codon:yes gene_type:complete
MNLFCFGFGQVARNFVKKLISENIELKLSFTSRKSKNEIDKSFKGNFFKFDGEFFEKDLIKNLKSADHILISIPPVNREDLVINNFSRYLSQIKPKWITYLSATSVYGNHNGAWVDEKSETNPTSENGIQRLVAENLWLSTCKKFNLPIQIFRLSGIYSNTNNILQRLKLGTAKIIKKENHFFSRIHVDDIANILFNSLKNFKSEEIYNISDDKPSSSEEVTVYAAKLLKLNIPGEIKIEDIDSKMLQNFYKDSKKVSNSKMKNFFNYNLKFSSYIEGLNHIRDNSI